MSAAAFSPVPSSVIAALAGQLLFVTALPIVLLVWWRRRSRASLTPAVIGMVAFLVFAQLLEQVLHYAFLISDNAVSRAIAANPGLYVLYAGLAAGLFEETGRFMAFKYLLRRSGGRETAVSYGLGHGGYECLAVSGAAALSCLLLALLINSGLVPTLLDLFTGDEAALVTQALEQVASITPTECLWGAVERAIALLLQVSLSVLVFASVWQPERGWLYLAAICLHALADFPAAAYQAGLLAGPGGLVAAELGTLVVAVLSAWQARRLWAQLPRAEQLQKNPDSSKQ